MANWRQVITKIVSNADERFDALRYQLKKRLGYDAPYQIVPYRGYGTADSIFLQGRVLEDKGITAASDNDTVWRNLLNMYRRIESDEVSFARVRAQFLENEQIVVADDDGFFEVNFKLPKPLADNRLWQDIDLELIDPKSKAGPPTGSVGQVLVPTQEVEYGVISDIDDTIVWTNATDKLRMARIVFLNNVRTRLPFKGVSGFYRALHQGASGNAQNPIFYVSSSPWNLYDLLSEFFDIHGIPPGPILLQNMGSSRKYFFHSNHRDHKLSKIKPILELYPKLSFILIGDSGQHDPEIYREVVSSYPNRILAIYIRNISPDPLRQQSISRLAEEVRDAGSQLVLAHDSLFAATHAAENGWILRETLPTIDSEKKADDRAPSEIEKSIK
jgi:phosphatidate phosphatase APP1